MGIETSRYFAGHVYTVGGKVHTEGWFFLIGFGIVGLLIPSIMSYFKNLSQNMNKSNSTAQVSESSDDIAKYHQLMEDGVITQEEFESKKSQILNS